MHGHSHNPEIDEAIDNFYQQYGKYVLLEDETRKVADKDIGTKTLTEELYTIREERLL